jgi:uncharacterized protein YjaZ
MWNSILQFQHLYSKDNSIIAKYTEEAPFTAFFSQASPGRAAIWIGYKIVSAYMEKHPKVSVQDLLLKTKAQDVLKGADYHP